MRGLDEGDQLLVHPFACDSSIRDTPSGHPLPSRSVSPPSVAGTEVETRPRLTRLLDEAPGTVPDDGHRDLIVHPVAPADSLAGVALRYGISIAALRRANQLWPSDPVHLRTELLIPRGGTLRASRKPVHSQYTDTASPSIVEPTPGSSPDVVASSFAAARNMILSVLPARISLDSLSSKTSASEDHELDDLQTARTPMISANESSFAAEGYELSIMAVPHTLCKRPGLPPLPPPPCTPTDNHQPDLDHHTTHVGDVHSQSISSDLSPVGSLGQPPHALPFAVLPVRTSQLEPEPAMELPVQRPRLQSWSFSDAQCAISKNKVPD